ncbi:hypothetical protein Pcinc_002929 [Petrolisthes cinctipes]|uniref:Uncharacterized protein n=1 Tax=Petrolisthes cinctipes TaxID=88211 RepID=A0AAE1L2H4_PETCI|nr:hypothetical protein Pcinc_002929 [Petrolisthes cinctipes]
MVLQKQFSRGPWREEGEGVERGRNGATSRSGQRKHSRRPRPWRTTATGGGIWSTTHLVGDPTTQPRVKGARRRKIDQSQEWLGYIGKKGGGNIGITKTTSALSRWALSFNL